MRARYWDNAITIWRQARWTGVGADGYATARQRIQPDRLRVRHAHGYLPQTLADLGLIGMGIDARAAARVVRRRRPGDRRASAPALGCVAARGRAQS